MDTIGKWPNVHSLYGEDEVKLHKQMWDVMTRERDGKPKKHQYVAWCLRIHSAKIGDADGKSAYANLARDVF